MVKLGSLFALFGMFEISFSLTGGMVGILVGMGITQLLPLFIRVHSLSLSVSLSLSNLFNKENFCSVLGQHSHHCKTGD